MPPADNWPISHKSKEIQYQITMKYKVLKEEVVYDNYFQLIHGHIVHDTFHQDDQISIERTYFHRGNSVAILIYEKDTDTILLTCQFRYPTIQKTNGWIYELPAGSIEEDEEPYACAKREVLEEIGYEVKEMKKVSEFFASPGGASELITLYYCEVHSSDKIEDGGGVAHEHEDIKLIKLPVAQIGEHISSGKILDAKTIIGLQWYMTKNN